MVKDVIRRGFSLRRPKLNLSHQSEDTSTICEYECSLSAMDSDVEEFDFGGGEMCMSCLRHWVGGWVGRGVLAC